MNITNIIWDVMYIQYDMMSRDGGAVMITFQDRMVSVALMMDLRCSYTPYCITP